MTKKDKIKLGSLVIAAENLNIEKQDIQDILYQIPEHLRSAYPEPNRLKQVMLNSSEDMHSLFIVAMEDLDMLKNAKVDNDGNYKIAGLLRNELTYNILHYTEEQKLSAYDDYDMKVFE